MVYIVAPYPICAVCGKKVERLEYEINIRTDEHVFIAVCHGEEEKVIIPRKALIEGVKFEQGVAFANSVKKIAKPESSM